MSAYTQRRSLVELIASGARARSHRAVMRSLWLSGAQTDLELCGTTGVSRSGVCGRIHELAAIGYVEEHTPVKCGTTGKLVRRSMLTPQGYSVASDLVKKEPQEYTGGLAV